ncbi:alpha/beta fold hydrolase [Schaalia vaccimaxillae]|uniref:alpha/beta fold hydrolase n=1 Tax=Schaalia vaccimaxillae TaxID=183916 RepID=UPI0003B7A520|nr:alpha/beta hydrolase [Schaalia vaccimaxillae]
MSQPEIPKLEPTVLNFDFFDLFRTHLETEQMQPDFMPPQPKQHVIFLHGLGATPQSWTYQIDHLPSEFIGIALRLPGTHNDDAPFNLSKSADKIIRDLDARTISTAHLCGLSLGAMVATQVAINHPDRISSLTLCASQAHPPRFLMRLQRLVMHGLPARALEMPDLSKARMLQILDAVAEVDLRPCLPTLNMPTLVVCGSKDKANLASSREISSLIPQARMRVINDGSHELNTGQPEILSDLLNNFLSDITGRSL